MSATQKTLAELPQIKENNQKFDYLKAKYIFRYPFTFTSIKWSILLGSFLGLHTFIKTRNIKKSFQYMVWGSFFLTFPIWAFFMTKYTFYQSSIQMFQEQQTNKIRDIDTYKNYIEFKLKLPQHNAIQQDELMQRYQQFLKSNFDKNCQLDCLLNTVTNKTYDIC